MNLFYSSTTKTIASLSSERRAPLDARTTVRNRRRTYVTCGIARLAMVRPEMRSDRKAPSPYSGAHWKIGKKNCSPRTSFLTQVWFLNRWSGSSGKKTSPSLCLSFWSVVRFGGSETWWTSWWGWGRGTGRGGGWSTLTTAWGCGSEKLSTLLEFTPIGSVVVRWVFRRKTNGKCSLWRWETAWQVNL